MQVLGISSSGSRSSNAQDQVRSSGVPGCKARGSAFGLNSAVVPLTSWEPSLHAGAQGVPEVVAGIGHESMALSSIVLHRV